QAPVCVRRAAVRCQRAAESLADTDAVAVATGDRLVHLAARFFGGPETAIGQNGLNVFARKSRERDFEIVDGGRTVHGKCAGITTLHQVDQYRSQAALDDVAAESPDDGLTARARLDQCFHHGAERTGSQYLRQRVEPAAHAAAPGIWSREVLHAHLAAARG